MQSLSSEVQDDGRKNREIQSNVRIWTGIVLRFRVLAHWSCSYRLNMQKQRPLPSGSVTANSRSPQV